MDKIQVELYYNPDDKCLYTIFLTESDAQRCEAGKFILTQCAVFLLPNKIFCRLGIYATNVGPCRKCHQCR